MIPVRARVIISKPIAFGGGTSPWVGRKGTVRKALKTSRAVLVQLDDDDREPFMFFVRELDVLTDE